MRQVNFVFKSSLLHHLSVLHLPRPSLPAFGCTPALTDWNLLQRGTGVKSLTARSSLPGFKSTGTKYLKFKTLRTMP